MSDYQGQYIFLNFSTTWCTYCHAEIPELEEFARTNEIQCFYVMSPVIEYNEGNIEKYLEDNDLEIEVIVDEEAALFYYTESTAIRLLSLFLRMASSWLMPTGRCLWMVSISFLITACLCMRKRIPERKNESYLYHLLGKIS